MTYLSGKLAVGILAAGIGAAGIVHAQTYPAKPITFLYPYASGSGTDTSWRAVTEEVGKLLGTTIVYENRPGAGGKISTQGIMRAAPDGYTIGMANSQIIVNLAVQDADFQVRPGKDYQPIANVMETFITLYGRADLPFKDGRGLVNYAKSNPGKLNIGAPGAVFLVDLMKMEGGMDFAQVNFQGEAPALTALLGGHIDAFAGGGGAKPYVDKGQIQAIATSGARRWSLYPNVPTLVEQGYPNIYDSVWLGAIGPAGMPRPVVDRLNKAFNDALASQRVKETLAQFGMDPRGSTPEEFSQLTQKDIDRKGPILRATNPNK